MSKVAEHKQHKSWRRLDSCSRAVRRPITDNDTNTTPPPTAMRRRLLVTQKQTLAAVSAAATGLAQAQAHEQGDDGKKAAFDTSV